MQTTVGWMQSLPLHGGVHRFTEQGTNLISNLIRQPLTFLLLIAGLMAKQFVHQEPEWSSEGVMIQYIGELDR
ncbi:hypothetical protein B4900_15655 [Yersinia rohdei]|nr:hypothetical protein B4900_15655 [Yersinia rohdei]